MLRFIHSFGFKQNHKAISHWKVLASKNIRHVFSRFQELQQTWGSCAFEFSGLIFRYNVQVALGCMEHHSLVTIYERLSFVERKRRRWTLTTLECETRSRKGNYICRMLYFWWNCKGDTSSSNAFHRHIFHGSNVSRASINSPWSGACAPEIRTLRVGGQCLWGSPKWDPGWK